MQISFLKTPINGLSLQMVLRFQPECCQDSNLGQPVSHIDII